MASVGFIGENRVLDNFPGSYGSPLLGHTLRLYKNFYSFGTSMLDQYGELYRCSAAFMRFLVAASPEAVNFILKDNEEDFSCKLGWEHFYGRVFPQSLPVMDDREHRHHRRILQSVFKKANMVAYAQMIDEMAGKTVSAWPINEQIKMFDYSKSLTLDIACSAFLGLSLDGSAESVGKTFLTLNKGIGAIVPVPIPGLALWRALKAQKKLLAHFRPMIAEKRASSSVDMFSALCAAKDENDETLSEDAILFHLLQFLAAAHDTSTTTLSVIFYYLTQNPEWQHKIIEEILSIKAASLEYHQLELMVDTECVIREALRLYPPAPLMFRRCVRDCNYKDYEIKAGTQIAIDIAAIHHSEKYWKEPTLFRPERFKGGEAENKGRPYTWFPFGGGAHTCMGLHFTFMELKIVLFHIFRRYKIRLEGEPDTFQILPITKPRRGLPLMLTKQ